MWSPLASFAGIFVVALAGGVRALTEQEIREQVAEYNVLAVNYCNSQVQAAWNVETNVGDTTYEDVQIQVDAANAAFVKQQHPKFAAIEASSIADRTLRRQVVELQKLGMAALEATRMEQFTQIVNRMSTVYNKAVICPFENQRCDLAGSDVLKLDPDMHDIMDDSKDYDKLQYTWQQWHEKAGRPMRDDFKTYVDIMNEAAAANGHADAARWWQSDYENMDFDGVDRLWQTVRPLYDELHRYVRNKLDKVYPGKLAAHAPYMPAHVLGNMWAQSWSGLYESTKPFDIDDNLGGVSERMAEQMDVKRMFEIADDFFTKMGLPSNAMSFDPERAFMEAPTDGRQIACHASAWDFCKDGDFRIKMCTSVNLRDFVTIHHEMGHIAYYQLYAEQPLQLRGGANPAFHEAVGDAIALSFSNPKHLTKIGLLDANTNAAEERDREINALYLMALDRVAFLPFGLLVDKWRWEVFNGTTPQDRWNERFWELRKEYQQLVSPVERTADDFDAGGKFHVPANSQYIGYFYAALLQFQMYRSFCIEAKQFDPLNPSVAPLHQCDFYGSVPAGDKMKAGLRIGTAQPWTEVLATMTGESTINGDALMEYFRPLYEHLKQVNRQAELDVVREQLSTHHQESVQFCNALQNADWDMTTDLENDAKKASYQQQVQLSAGFMKNQFNTHFKHLNPDDFADDESISRQLKYLTKLGTDILSPARLAELGEVKAAMSLVYNQAQVCPYTKRDCNEATEGMPLNPDIERIMSESEDFDELRHVWAKWHDNTGTHMRENYKKYIEISNEAATLNGFADNGEMWRFDYEDDAFQANMLALWAQVEPLYDALHTFVRHRLIDAYGTERMDVNDTLIPAHLLGNMWAQSWVNLYERIKPFPNASDIDVSASMQEQFTVMKMFEESDRFYKDLGLKSNEMSYKGEKPIIEKPTDRLIVCHASAWDFCNGEDFRIKQCTLINQKDLVTVHHEMGHIQYYIQYAGQPMPFRKGANPGFHEAVGDLIALSVSTPQHLQKIGLLRDYADTEEDNVNSLLKMALERVAFLPFGLVIDMYRWELFAGKVPQSGWNARYLELREKYQKIRSPVARSETNFDAGAKFHVASDYQYMNYFVAHILEFQLHLAMCKEAGQLAGGRPLHKCDIDGNKAVGKKLAAGLSAGLSKHWSDTLEVMSGDRVLKADAMLEYFGPLKVYLDRENAKWKPPGDGDLTDPDVPNPKPDPEPTKPDDAEAPPLVPIIVGSVLGGALAGGVLVAVTYYLCTRNRKLVSASTSSNRLV